MIMEPEKKEKIFTWYKKRLPMISSISLFAGFLFNIIALKRASNFNEIFWIVTHILSISILIILLNKTDNSEENSSSFISNVKSFIEWVIQFLLGGLLSTFIVFYFRSSVIEVSWPFLAILIFAFIANERFKRYYTWLSFQISFLFFCIYIFYIFYIPTLFHSVSLFTFIVSGIVSLITVSFFLYLIFYFSRRKENNIITKTIILPILGIFALINLLYFLNVIPPLPLTLEDSNIYYSIVKNDLGNYEVKSVAKNTGILDNVLNFFTINRKYTFANNQTVYFYSAIFSPINFKLNIVHEWQKYNSSKNIWETEAIVPLYVSGGRDGGYRTFSSISRYTGGRWRINIKTESGQIIGRENFELVVSDTTPQLETKTQY